MQTAHADPLPRAVRPHDRPPGGCAAPVTSLAVTLVCHRAQIRLCRVKIAGFAHTGPDGPGADHPDDPAGSAAPSWASNRGLVTRKTTGSTGMAANKIYNRMAFIYRGRAI